jgi:pyruvate dehydrogenase E2 component (dihydrolipoamide acetyltransferase)
MPALGMAQETGRLIAWLKQEGDTVKRGDPLMEVETDKTTVEVEAFASGVLANVSAQPGDDVPVGDVIALILEPGEEAPAPKREKAAPATSSSVANSSNHNPAKIATPVAARVAEANGVDLQQVPAQGRRVTRSDVEAYLDDSVAASTGHILASPKARRLAGERGVELTYITGNGPNGAILADDVLSYVPVAANGRETPVETRATVSGAQTGTMWRRMAVRLTESWQTVPHFYLKRDVNASALINWRKSVMNRSEVKVTFTDLLVKAVAVALKTHPHVNGQWRNDAVIFNASVNIGLAVAVDEGLLVPVIHHADTLGVGAIAQRRKEIVDRALQGKLKPDDLQGGTFTISNLGMYGIDEFSAIVNPPQAAILAVGRIIERLIPLDGKPEICPTLTLNLSCDHRAVDGARGAQFMETLSQLIEEPLTIID